MISPHPKYVALVRTLTPALKVRPRLPRGATAAQRRDLNVALRWNASRNIVGFGVGPKWTGGEPDHDTTAVTVFVLTKLPKSKVLGSELVPKMAQFHSVRGRVLTDVVEVGSLPRLQASALLQPGTSAAHFTMRDGTLTAVVRARLAPRPLLLLSCCHGFAPPGTSGRQVESPPDLSASTITNHVGNVTQFEPLRPGGNVANRFDAALALPLPEMVPRLNNTIPGLGRLTSASSLSSGDFVRNGIHDFVGVGAVTARVRGRIIAENASTLFVDLFGRRFLFQDLVAYDPQPLTQAGDSGMPLFLATAAGLQLIGMHIGLGKILGTNRGAAFFVPIRPVLERMSVDLA